MSKIIIAIDPDVDKSGVAVWNDDLRSIYSLSFFDLQEKLLSMSINTSLIVIVESGWLNKSNWHSKIYPSGYYSSGQIASIQAQASKIGEKIGANHQVGKIIVELCRYFGIEVIEQKPLAKIWGKGKDKISHKELDYFVPNLPKQTNQEERDAVLLLWNYLKKPIKKMTKNQTNGL